MAELNEREQEGFMKAFEFSFELAWHTLDAFGIWKGSTRLAGAALPRLRAGL